MEEHPANVQANQILTIEGSTEFFNVLKIVCPAKKQFCFSISKFDVKLASELPDGDNPGVCRETAKGGEVMISEPSWKANFQTELFQRSGNKTESTSGTPGDVLFPGDTKGG